MHSVGYHQARTRPVSLRQDEDPIVGLYRILAKLRKHYTYLGLSLTWSEDNLFRLYFSTGDIFNSDNVLVGLRNMISKIFGPLYDLSQETVQDLSNGEELVDNSTLRGGMVLFNGCVRAAGCKLPFLWRLVLDFPFFVINGISTIIFNF